jgi:hypothetical protein
VPRKGARVRRHDCTKTGHGEKIGQPVTHPHLYEISTWPWLERLSLREGRRVTLCDVPPAEWDGLAERGFHLVYLMGVWRRSPLGREIALQDPVLRGELDRALPGWTDADVVGSAYSVQEYEPDARMGGWHGLGCARRELNRRGMRLIVDFVTNHTGFDHPWVTESPDRYVLGTDEQARATPEDFRRVGDVWIACGRDPFFPPWHDVGQLNYFNPETRSAMIQVLQRIAEHCDGVRCDMAMLVLNDIFDRTWYRIVRARWPQPDREFWPEATRTVPDLLYLAEVYWDLEWTLQEMGFHYTYDKRLLDRVQGASPAELRAHLAAEAPFRDRLARFLENHDEPRSAAALERRLPAAATLLATLPGLRFYFDGQLEGRRVRTPVQLGRWVDEPPDERIRDLYRRLLTVSAMPLFHEGEWTLLDVAGAGDDSFTSLIAYRWRHEDRLAVMVANVGDGTASGHVSIASELPPKQVFDVRDILADAVYTWERTGLAEHGLYVRLPAGGAHLFVSG